MPPANYIAYTAPINPPSESPVLTRVQIWAGLQKKIRAGQDFVRAAITATEVVKEYRTEKTDLPVTERKVTFSGPPQRVVEETCISYYPMKVEFHQKDGSKVMNVISQGAGGEEDLYMTYTYEWLHPDLEGKEDELKAAHEGETKMAKDSVDSTIKAMRAMVKDGSIN